MLRRHGVSEADADDAAQRVFLVLARKQGEVEVGHELPYLAPHRASSSRRRRAARTADAASLRRRRPMSPRPRRTAPTRRWSNAKRSSAIDAILERMDEALRTVFVLHEIEELTMAQIAETLQVPPGTVASRLRRARERVRVDVRRR